MPFNCVTNQLAHTHCKQNNSFIFMQLTLHCSNCNNQLVKNDDCYCKSSVHLYINSYMNNVKSKPPPEVIYCSDFLKLVPSTNFDKC